MDYGSITYTDQQNQVQRVVLRLGSITIGRAPENDVVLDDDQVAPIHLRLVCTTDSCWALDLDSGSGTFFNQVRLQPNARHFLRNGDSLRIGPFTIQYNRQPAVLPPTVAAKVPLPPLVPRLRGNAGPPRMQRQLPYTYEMSNYLQYLPPCYHDDRFLGQFLLIFESILDPIERVIDQIHLYFDPGLTPEGLLPWLATWVDLVLNEKWTIERRRALVRAAAELYRWRGTRYGLFEYIRIYTGVEPMIDEPTGEYTPNDPAALPAHVFRVILEVPDPAQIDRRLVESIIEAEKPAHTGYLLDIRQKAASQP